MSTATTADFQAALAGVACPKMRRSWRNRSNVVQWHWVGYARIILGPDATRHDCYRLGACLYVACGWYAARAGSDTFNSDTVPPRGWDLIRAMTEDFLAAPPDRALTRGAWEEQRQKDAAAHKAARKLERQKKGA